MNRRMKHVFFLTQASSDGTDQRCYADGSQTKPDYRQMCKYGVNCYQKNPMHHQKFKHPSKEAEKPETEEVEQEAKDEPKPEDLKDEEPKTVVKSITSRCSLTKLLKLRKLRNVKAQGILIKTGWFCPKNSS